MAFSAGSAQTDAASAMLPRLIHFAEHWELLLSQGGHVSTAPGMRCMTCGQFGMCCAVCNLHWPFADLARRSTCMM